MKAAEEKKKLLESRLSGIVSKPDDDDFITERTRKVIDDCERNYRMATLKRDLHKAALELLQKYKFNLEQIERMEPETTSEEDALHRLDEIMNTFDLHGRFPNRGKGVKNDHKPHHP
jgi:hypothetical protein